MNTKPESIRYHSIYMESIQELHRIHHEVLSELLNKTDAIYIESTPEKGLITPNILYHQELLKTLQSSNVKD